MTGTPRNWAALRSDIADTRAGAMTPESFTEVGRQMSEAIARIRIMMAHMRQDEAHFRRVWGQCWPGSLG